MLWDDPKPCPSVTTHVFPFLRAFAYLTEVKAHVALSPQLDTPDPVLAGNQLAIRAIIHLGLENVSDLAQNTETTIKGLRDVPRLLLCGRGYSNQVGGIQ